MNEANRELSGTIAPVVIGAQARPAETAPSKLSREFLAVVSHLL